ncbi:MAG: HlyD family secretion protein [Hydrogenothermaceae bacterium]|nr:HlyD family secretion protein [Hydrogenothermaceae bacterium]
MNKKKIGTLVVSLLLLNFLVLAVRWIDHRINYIITDAVFVETDYLSNVGFSRVGGKVIQLYKKEGDEVKANEEIGKIEETDYRVQLEAINSKIESLKSQRSQLESQLSRVEKETDLNIQIQDLSEKEISKRIESLEAQIIQLNSQIELSKKDLERFKNLAEKGLAPVRKFEEVKTNLDVLLSQKMSLEKSIAELRVSKEKAVKSKEYAKAQEGILEEISAQISAVSKQIQALEKEREDLLNQINYTVLKSPYDGIVAKKYVSIGDIVKAGQPVYAIVKNDSFYIKVLLEETKLKGLRVGNRAFIRLDAYPDVLFEGVVESINIASAAKFALVPRDISAGEFTKLAQRIPVKIKITKGDKFLLRVGLGGEIEIEKKR